MKRIIRIIRIRIKVSKRKVRSADPIAAYKAHLEVEIYTAVLNLIIKELKKEEAELAATVEAAAIGPTVQIA